MKNNNTAVLVLSYCLNKDGTRLTKMAEESTELGIATVCAGEASHIIFPTAYGCWEKEAKLKMETAIKAGITPDKIKIIEGVRHTFDEVSGLRKHIYRLRPKKLIVVSEKYHTPRLKRMLKNEFPGIELDFRIFQATRYEQTLEPSWVKAHRGSHFMWWLWNFICNLVW